MDEANELDILLEYSKAMTDKKGFDATIKACIAAILKQRAETLEVAEKERKEIELEARFKDSLNIDLNDIIVMTDMAITKSKEHANKFLVNAKTGNLITSISVMGMEAQLGKAAFTQLTEVNIPAIKRYDPYRINTTLQDRKWAEKLPDIDAEITVVNTCIHPPWRYSRDKTIRPLEEDIAFLDGSFTSDEDRQFFYDAFYTSVTTKMHNGIFLYGFKGTGKTTIIDMLENCVGASNYKKFPNKITNGFNPEYKNTRVGLFDEAKANNDEDMNTIKSNSNRQISINDKFQKREVVENFLSPWYATNNLRDWKFTYDERRFSTLELNPKTTLERGISDEYMAGLSERMWTDDFSQGIYNLAEERRTKNFNPMTVHRSPLFYRIVLSSLSVVQTAIVDIITGKDKVSSVSMELVNDPKARNAITRHDAVEGFLENYRHYDPVSKEKHSLGVYVRGRTIQTSYIIPSKHYRSEIKDNSDLED
tara:strand:- start:794 stop:2230 length:1437 start_codon:yes stop_codon:yes gene_type:complete